MRQPRLERRREATVQVVAAECATQERVPEAVVVRPTLAGLGAMVQVVTARRAVSAQPVDVDPAEQTAAVARAVQPADVAVAAQTAAMAPVVQPADVAVVARPAAMARAVQTADVAEVVQSAAMAPAEELADVARVEPQAAAWAAVVEAAEEPAAHQISV